MRIELKDTLAVAVKMFLLFVLLLLTTSAYAQLTIDGEIRPRTELRRGFKTLPATGSKPAFFTEQRSRLTMGYMQTDMEFKLSLQDVRIWGSEPQLAKNDGLFSLHEAWGKVNLGTSTFIKAGRQELVYDDHRILGNVNWTAQGRSHDALLLGTELSDWTLHLGLAYNQDDDVPEPAKLAGTYYRGASYKALQYIWAGREFEQLTASILLLNNGLQRPDSTVNYTQTAGLNLAHTLSSGSTVSASLFFQSGRDAADRTVSALLAAAWVEMSIDSDIRLRTGVDYLSGSAPDDDRNRSFNPLYGTNHAFYGHMDYFYVGNPHRQVTGSNSNSSGLVDIYVRPVIQLGGGGSLSLTLHSFFSPVSIEDPSSPGRSLPGFLGIEGDLGFSYRLADAVTFQTGYSQMFGTPSLEVLKGGDHTAYSGWGWVMFRFAPTLYSGGE